jgi:thymidylate synthase
MIHVFEASTADQVWADAAERLGSSDDVIRQPSRIGYTLEMLHTVLSITEPRERWVLSRRPAMNPAFAIAEVVWIIAGRNDSAFINHWNPALPRFAGTGTTYHGAYGHRLRRSLAIDQLQHAYGTLRANPDSRQVVLQIWDSSRDLPFEDGQPRDPDIPCNICSMLKIREGRLDWVQVLRSNDLFLGVPHNIVQFTTLQEVLAGWLGVELGSYHQMSDSLHIYERDADQVRQRVQPTKIRNSDTLMLPKPQADSVWGEIEDRMSRLVGHPDMTQRRWVELTSALNIPQPFVNLWAIVAADDARRRGWMDYAEDVMSQCTNPLLNEAWKGWLSRKAGQDLHVSVVQ